MKEVHEGVCETHIGSQALASKVTRVNYYLPTLERDFTEFVKRCDKGQRFADLHKAPQEPLHPIMSPWPFHTCGVKFLIVVVHRFTKWVEVKPVATISTERVKQFYLKKIICHFGLPSVIISANGTQFAS
ncbi:hypothetical protein CR513_28331, partial [Mucuna pruriens]